jgi:hypothetical protein
VDPPVQILIELTRCFDEVTLQLLLNFALTRIRNL